MDEYTPNPNIPTAANRAPGPFAFVRSPDAGEADDQNHDRDASEEHFDGSWRDR